MRAIERAGNKLKGRAGRLRDTLRGVRPVLAAATLGPSLVADAFSLDDLVGGDAHVDVISRYQVWAQQTAEEASNITGELIGGWSTSARVRLAENQAAHIAESVDFLRNELDEITRLRVFDASLITSGDLVPTGFARSVLAIAGGTTDLTTQGYAYVALTTHGTAPVPGLATGPDIIEAGTGAGAVVEAYRWIYGPAQRGVTFKPHRRLDGKAFINFDDPVLANTTGWPPYSHYMPGDHAGCRCDYEPVLLSPEEAAAIGRGPTTPPVPAPVDDGDPFAGSQFKPLQPDPPVPPRPVPAPEPAARPAPRPEELPSSAIGYKTPAARKAFEPTMRKLDELHRIEPGQLPETQIIKGGKSDYKGGHFSPGNRPPKPKRNRAESFDTHMAKLREWSTSDLVPEIRINDRGDGQQLLTLLHEFGHRLDYVGGPVEQLTFVTKNTRYYSQRTSDAVRRFFEATRATPTISDAYTRFRKLDYVRYFESPHEQWARAYSQWAANRLGGEYRAALESALNEPVLYQWTDEEFELIAPLVEDILRERGLL